MDLRDEVRSRFDRCHRLAQKRYNEGDIARARTGYLECVRLLEHLASLSPPSRRSSILARAKRFEDIAEGLQSGTIEVYTNGIPPPERAAPPGKTTKAARAEKAEELVLATKPNLRFSDIAGLDDVKENVKEAIVYPFTHPEEYEYFGVKPGGGILLYGPPGCGKTLMAAAAAGECDAAFISLKVSDIKDKYVGESEKNLRQVFETARSHDRAILFFDEIDSLAGDRSGGGEGHEKSLVSEFLAQMDGLEAKGVARNHLVLAATNRPWDIDIALRRSGRFDTTVSVPHPDYNARRRILELSLKKRPLQRDLDLGELAHLTDGLASAEIVDLCDRAARVPLRERIKEGQPRRQIARSDFDRALTGRKSILPTWYIQAAKELAGSDQVGIFQELKDAAMEYWQPGERHLPDQQPS